MNDREKSLALISKYERLRVRRALRAVAKRPSYPPMATTRLTRSMLCLPLRRSTLLAAVESMGGVPVDLGIVRDKEASLKDAVEAGLKHCEVLVTSGGVSMGEADLLKPILEVWESTDVVVNAFAISSNTLLRRQGMGPKITGKGLWQANVARSRQVACARVCFVDGRSRGDQTGPSLYLV